MLKLSLSYYHSQEGVLGMSMKWIKPKLTSEKNLNQVTPRIIKSIIENDDFHQLRARKIVEFMNSVSLNHSIMTNLVQTEKASKRPITRSSSKLYLNTLSPVSLLPTIIFDVISCQNSLIIDIKWSRNHQDVWAGKVNCVGTNYRRNSLLG